MMLPDDVMERLQLLRDSEQIAEETFTRVKEEIETLIETGQINPQKESIGSMTSHLAIAAERMNRGEPVTEMTEQIDEVIAENPSLYELAEQVIARCLWREGAYQTRAEAGFMTLYFATLQ